MKKSKRSLLITLTLLFSMFLVACSGDQEGSEGDNKSNKEVAQELNLNINTEPFSLNPGLANDSTSSAVLLQTFEGLTRIGQDGQPEPAMASEINVSDDLKTYTFKIREGVTWTNGDPVTAQDFEWAWKWVLNPKTESQYAYQLYYVKNAKAAKEGKVPIDQVGVKALDERTLEVSLENPTPYFLELTAFYTYFPVNSKIAKENPKWYQDAGELYTSNGPFKMTTWEHNDSIVLEKNEDYWDANAVKLNKIKMVMINDPNTELSMYQNGELDWAGRPTGELPLEAIPTLKKNGELEVKPIAGTYWYKFNTEKEPFNNVNIRKAFAYSIDRQAIVEEITKGGQVPAMAVVPSTMFPDNKKGYFKDNDLDKAKQHLEKGLKELGYASVEDMPEIKLSYNTTDAHAKIAQAIQAMWKKNLGVEVGLENAEWAVYIEKLHGGDYQIGRMGWLGDFNDPVNFLELFKEKGGNNDTRWTNKEFQALLNQSAAETDPEKRQKLLKDAEKIFVDEMPVAPIYFYTNAYVKRDNVKGVVISGLGDAQYKWAYIK